MASASFVKFWYYHLPDMVLAALCYLLVARFVFSLFGMPQNRLAGAIATVTEPVVAATTAITPRVVSWLLLPLAALGWLYAARILLRAGFAAAGIRLA